MCRVTKLLHYVLYFGHLQQLNVAQQLIFAKVGAKFCQILNKLSKNSRKLSKFCQIWSHYVLCLHWLALSQKFVLYHSIQVPNRNSWEARLLFAAIEPLMEFVLLKLDVRQQIFLVVWALVLVKWSAYMLPSTLTFWVRILLTLLWFIVWKIRPRYC